jgi:hypothetical protein
MMMRRTTMAWLGLLAIGVGACATQTTQAPEQSAPAAAPAEAAAEPARVPPPADSPLAKIHKGMPMGQVAEILGQPSDQHQYVTGKAFIPWYYGDDVTRVQWHYKGVGRVIFTGGGAFGQGGGAVEWVEYDPTESGYRKPG